MKNGWLAGAPIGGTYYRMSSFGTIRSGKGREAVAVIGCAVGDEGADTLVMYDSRSRIVGTVKLGRVFAGGSRSVRKVKISKGRIYVDVAGVALRGDGSYDGSGDARIVLRWDAKKKKFVVVKKTVYTERPYFDAIIARAKKGDTKGIVKVSGMSTVEARSVVRTVKDLKPRRGWRIVTTCWGSEEGRSCTYGQKPIKKDPDANLYTGIRMTMVRTGWRSYQVVYVSPFG